MRMTPFNPLTCIDFYKAAHREQYPQGTTEVYSNFTARSGKWATMMPSDWDGKIVCFGLQYFVKSFLQGAWNEYFFQRPKEEVVAFYRHRMDCALGKGSIKTDHIEALHDLGFLPLSIKAIGEGERVPVGVPVLTVKNTRPEFFWLTNYIESAMSACLWKAMTSATIAFEYKKLLTKYAKKTGASLDFVEIQGHDFSFRGMSGIEDAAVSGAAHLTSFKGTDSVPAIDLLEGYYNANAATEFVGGSIPATEHSVMCMGTQEKELDTFKRLITEVYPTGMVSIVSDTWDFWEVVTSFMKELKDLILRREGAVILRPDSGDPVKIICGDVTAPKNTPEYKGAVECLWDIFGGDYTKAGYKTLNPHIGLIYGDSITLQRAHDILDGLALKGFASSNVVLGIGSYTYQYVTRDTFGFAMKATSGVVNGERRDIFKSPKTDDGVKKSAKGLLRVEQEGGEYVLYDNQSAEEERKGKLLPFFTNGRIHQETDLTQIREKLRKYIEE